MNRIQKPLLVLIAVLVVLPCFVVGVSAVDSDGYDGYLRGGSYVFNTNIEIEPYGVTADNSTRYFNVGLTTIVDGETKYFNQIVIISYWNYDDDLNATLDYFDMHYVVKETQDYIEVYSRNGFIDSSYMGIVIEGNYEVDEDTYYFIRDNTIYRDDIIVSQEYLLRNGTFVFDDTLNIDALDHGFSAAFTNFYLNFTVYINGTITQCNMITIISHYDLLSWGYPLQYFEVRYGSDVGGYTTYQVYRSDQGGWLQSSYREIYVNPAEAVTKQCFDFFNTNASYYGTTILPAAPYYGNEEIYFPNILGVHDFYIDCYAFYEEERIDFDAIRLDPINGMMLFHEAGQPFYDDGVEFGWLIAYWGDRWMFGEEPSEALRIIYTETSQIIDDRLYNFIMHNFETQPIPPYQADYTTWLGTAVKGFFDAELWPGFTLGGIFLIIVSFSIVVWFLKVFAGG